MQKLIRKISTLVCSLTLLSLVACQAPIKNTKTTDNGKTNIYTSFYPMYYFTSLLVGDTAEISNIMPAGVDSHDFEPSANMITDMMDADVIIYQGAGMEFWIDKLMETVQKESPEVKFIEAAKGIELIEAGADEHDDADAQGHDDADEHEGHNHRFDPHVWLSLRHAQTMLKNIHAELVTLFPEHKAQYDKNLDEAVKNLDALDQEFKDKIMASDLDKFIINHEAFAYFAADYNLEQIGISGVGTEQDPNPALLKDLVELAKTEQISVIFYDDSGSSKVSEALAKEIGGTVLPLTTIHAPTEEEINNAVDYVDFMRQNLENLLKAAN